MGAGESGVLFLYADPHASLKVAYSEVKVTSKVSKPIDSTLKTRERGMVTDDVIPNVCCFYFLCLRCNF